MGTHLTQCLFSAGIYKRTQQMVPFIVREPGSAMSDERKCSRNVCWCVRMFVLPFLFVCFLSTPLCVRYAFPTMLKRISFAIKGFVRRSLRTIHAPHTCHTRIHTFAPHFFIRICLPLTNHDFKTLSPLCLH